MNERRNQQLGDIAFGAEIPVLGPDSPVKRQSTGGAVDEQESFSETSPSSQHAAVAELADALG
ncbi:hypothetical protein LOC67_17420 [Stieleria sp. JC731]|uniref:hypothetical protein n=1 Tax=Roseiconus sp. JC912 TaxID=3396307 RepID=UPI003A4C5954|nr:hypothetical protein [Stieleria sp. JC731]